MFPNLDTKVLVRDSYLDDKGKSVPAIYQDLLDTFVDDFLVQNKQIQENKELILSKKVL